jgi:uncharacterized protein YaiI (UPF0178 family)
MPTLPVKDEIYRVRPTRPARQCRRGQFHPRAARSLIERIAATRDGRRRRRIAWRQGDIVTADIPLASRCVKAGAEVIAPNGKPFRKHRSA